MVSAQQLYSISFGGDVVSNRKLYLLLDDKRYHVIKDMKTITGTAYYCVKCENGFDHDDFSHHRCEGVPCGSCEQLNGIDFLNRPDHYEMIRCDLCCRGFFGQNFLLNHHTKTAEGQHATALTKSSVRYSHKKCQHCHKTIIGKTKHSCGKGKCYSCDKKVDLATHNCFLQPANPQRRKRKKRKRSDETGCEVGEETGSREIVPLFVFADIETMQEDGIHEPNLLIAETDESDEIHRWDGPSCVEEFLSWLEEKQSEDEQRNIIVLFHNFSGFDGYMILKELYNQCRTPDLIVNGAKLFRVAIDRIIF